ncbi:gamma-aminobutyric acid receptor subunit beta-2-like [Agrilus planipennis]|uniref:Gamma-aminobutyric acid receptor subunit beta-2-like n=1 Tax=Agrilus planipennis TaxID=224129 RepID=A0A1W4X9H3_AGRPL|nr:gamma-aminobutyric acid receptor subunit beta-2-like [Agrilus planipennis]
MCPLVITFIFLIAIISDNCTEIGAVNAEPSHDPVPSLNTFDYVSVNIRNGSIYSTETTASHTTELYSATEFISSNCETNSTDNCPILCGNFDDYSQNTILDMLLDPCRYDSDVIPSSVNPLDVQVRVQVSYMDVDTESQLLKTRLQVAFGYTDPRLAYHFLSPNKSALMGEEILIRRLWTPHIYVLNEKMSNVMGLDKSDMYVTIDPSGKVELNQRISLATHCWMDLMKFPFDEQTCSVDFQLWSYDVSKAILRWRKDNPVILSPNLFITEFDLNDYKAEEAAKLRSTDLNVHYSTLRLEFNVSRQIGYYIMDFFIPSILLVITSWVSFWLQADASPARVALGTSTMLAFITLTLGQYSNFPKVPYVTLGEIWFIGCTIFIFLSITEFAFANVIWRRKQVVNIPQY